MMTRTAEDGGAPLPVSNTAVVKLRVLWGLTANEIAVMLGVAQDSAFAKNLLADELRAERE